MLHLYSLLKIGAIHYEEPFMKLVLAESEQEAIIIAGGAKEWDVDKEIDLSEKGIVFIEDF